MKLKDRFAKLIDVKSIVTILTTIVFCGLVILGKEIPEPFTSIYTILIGFYFGTQAKKNIDEGK